LPERFEWAVQRGAAFSRVVSNLSVFVGRRRLMHDSLRREWASRYFSKPESICISTQKYSESRSSFFAADGAESQVVGARQQETRAAFVKTFKRDYIRINRLPDARTALSRIDHWMEGYNSELPGLAITHRESTLHHFNKPRVRSNRGKSRNVTMTYEPSIF
jgi:hypothetical protein